ncbi:MAG: thiamine pyrophosphate-dependent dehydrogenase E1 component subunit alpha [Fuerstiella sp.]|nr:thiamine pyrophosphate-dependent dehydrogenase E1 component subunit alpha [Fuerstiella sp.]
MSDVRKIKYPQSTSYPKEFHWSLLETMVLIRRCEESFIDPILDRRIQCPVHLYSGEEAIAAGVCACLTPEDTVFGNHRSHGHYLAKGGDLYGLIAEVYCKEDGCSRGRGGSMHLISKENGFLGAVPIVGGTIALALGAALAHQIRDNNAVAVAFFGDGAAGEGVLYEVMNFAGIHDIPLILVCENNLYSTHMPIREIRCRDTLFDTAIPFDVRTIREEGNNVLKVYEATRTAVAHCREKKGPVFLEFSTYRQRGHVGPNDNIQGSQTDIRPPEEIREWLTRDPIANYKKFLITEEIFRTEEIDEMDAMIIDRVKQAHKKAEQANRPAPEDLPKYVFK